MFTKGGQFALFLTTSVVFSRAQTGNYQLCPD